MKFIKDFWALITIWRALEEKILKPIKVPTVKSPLTTKVLPIPIIIIELRTIKKWLKFNWWLLNLFVVILFESCWLIAKENLEPIKLNIFIDFKKSLFSPRSYYYFYLEIMIFGYKNAIEEEWQQLILPEILMPEYYLKRIKLIILKMQKMHL